MKFQSVQKRIDWSAEDRARHKAVRERFQSEKPGPKQLFKHPVPLGMYLELKLLVQRLRREREAAGLSQSDVAERSGIDKASISKLENGKYLNPTLDTIFRYASALGKDIELHYVDKHIASQKKRSERRRPVGTRSST